MPCMTWRCHAKLVIMGSTADTSSSSAADDDACCDFLADADDETAEKVARVEPRTWAGLAADERYATRASVDGVAATVVASAARRGKIASRREGTHGATCSTSNSSCVCSASTAAGSASYCAVQRTTAPSTSAPTLFSHATAAAPPLATSARSRADSASRPRSARLLSRLLGTAAASSNADDAAGAGVEAEPSSRAEAVRTCWPSAVSHICHSRPSSALARAHPAANTASLAVGAKSASRMVRTGDERTSWRTASGRSALR